MNNLKILNTRFSPEINWYIHVGHLKNILHNLKLSKIYNGISNVRVDDTNNYKNKYKYKFNLKKTLFKLNKIFDKNFNKKIFYSSYYYFKLYQYFEFIFKWKLKKNYYKKKKLNILRLLKNGDYKEKNLIKNLFFLKSYRIKYKKHHKTKWCWFLYPLYDYSHNISDKIENIKYSLCTFEFKLNKPIYNIITNLLYYNYFKPVQLELNKLKIKNNILSKSKLKILINRKYLKNSYNNNYLLKNFQNFLKKKLINVSFKLFFKIKIKNINKKKLIKLNKTNSFMENKILIKNFKFFYFKKLKNFKKKLYLKNLKYFIYCFKFILKKNKIKNFVCKIYKKKIKNNFSKNFYWVNEFYKMEIIFVIFKNLIKSNRLYEKKENKFLILKFLKINFKKINYLKIKNNKIFI